MTLTNKEYHQCIHLCIGKTHKESMAQICELLPFTSSQGCQRQPLPKKTKLKWVKIQPNVTSVTLNHLEPEILGFMWWVCMQSGSAQLYLWVGPLLFTGVLKTASPKDKSAQGKNTTNVTNATVHCLKSALWGFTWWICIVAVRSYICEWGHFPSQGCHRQPVWWITSQIYYGPRAERKEKARVARGKSMAFRGVLFRLHFHLITLHLLWTWTILEKLLFMYSCIYHIIFYNLNFHLIRTYNFSQILSSLSSSG